MRVIHFFTHGDRLNEYHEYLAIQTPDDTEMKIPIYQKGSDDLYHRVEQIFFPACTKFFSGLDVKHDEDMSAEQIEETFGAIGAIA